MTINKKRLLIYIAATGLILLFAAKLPGNLFLKLTAAEEYSNIHLEYENMYQNLNMKRKYEENQSYLLNMINELNIDTEILQDKIIDVLSNISGRNRIEIGNIKFSEIMPVSVDDKESDEDLDGECKESHQDAALCMKVTVDFDGDFNDMLTFVDGIKSSEDEISVIDISILTIDGQRVHTVLNLMFYALPIYTGRQL